MTTAIPGKPSGWLRGGAAALFLCLSACRLAPGAGSSTDAGVGDSATAPGQVAVQARGCSHCHQSSDPNDGVLSGQTMAVDGSPNAYGSNLTPDPDNGLDAWDAATISNALRKGIDDHGQPLCPPMPRFADMSNDEAFAIAAYLQSLPPVWHPVPATRCARAMADGGS